MEEKQRAYGVRQRPVLPWLLQDHASQAPRTQYQGKLENMKFSRHQAIREVLLESEDGMTIQQVADKLGCGYKSIQKTIKLIWGVYIDRWSVPKRGQFAAVYMCVPRPAPHGALPASDYLGQA